MCDRVKTYFVCQHTAAHFISTHDVLKAALLINFIIVCVYVFCHAQLC